MQLLSPRRRAFLLVVLPLFACERPAPPAAGPRPVLAHTVGAAAAAAPFAYSGEVRARHEVPLAFRVAGKLVARMVEVGQTVAAGQLLARLDPADLALGTGSAAAVMAAAEAEHALAQAEARRFRELRAQNFVSQAALDARETALTAAAQRLAAARAQARLAANQQDHAVLSAEGAGVVAAVLAEPGQVVAAGQPVIRLARSGELEAAISIPENRLAEFRAAGELTVSLWAEGGRSFRGQLREISPQADPVTRTFAARVRLVDPGPAVRLGMTATVHASAANAGGALAIPATALYQDQGRPAVWVIGDDGKVASRLVGVRAYREEQVVLAEGLRAGERIAAAGVHLLHAGETVKVVGTR